MKNKMVNTSAEAVDLKMVLSNKELQSAIDSAVSAIFDKSRYSAFDIICFMALFWVADAWMESSPPSGFFIYLWL